MVEKIATDVMLYMSAQNELSGFADDNVDAIKTCVNLDNMSVYIMLDTFVDGNADGARSRRTFQYLLPPGASAAHFQPQDLLLDNKEVHSSVVFSHFLGLAEHHFSDRETLQKILILWGHGKGMFMLDENQKKGVERATASIAEFSEALIRKANENSPLRFDVLAFDSCYMCMLETMHELRNAVKYVLCSSTLVAAEGFPYDRIFTELKKNGKELRPESAANRIAELYNAHYKEIYSDGNRVLFVCDMSRIALCIRALNALGEKLSSLMRPAVSDGVRSAVAQASIAAGVDSSYVYVLRFLKALELTLDGEIATPELQEVRRLSDDLGTAVRSAFSGDMGDTTDRPISPLIWAPFLLSTFERYEEDYNGLASSGDGRGGWVSMWRKFHFLEAIKVGKPEKGKIKIGLPTLD